MLVTFEKNEHSPANSGFSPANFLFFSKFSRKLSNKVGDKALRQDSMKGSNISLKTHGNDFEHHSSENVDFAAINDE